ncbi:MAG: DUF507 family protein [Acidobacteriota bacterium]
MKLSHEKIVHLSHVIIDAVENDPALELCEPSNDVRKKILMVLRQELSLEEQIEERVRLKISSQKRTIPEGSQEWDILFRKYYEEEMSGHRGI